MRLARARLLLDHGLDADAALAEDARHLGQHPGAVLDLHAQVVGRLHGLHRQHRMVGEGVRLEGQMRDAVLGVGRHGAHHVDEVRDHRRGRGLGAGAGAVVERRPHRVAHHQHRVHDAVDVGDQAPLRDQGRVHAQLHALLRAPRDAEVLDAVAELARVGHVLGRQAADALGVDALELQRDAEGDGGEDGELVGGVDALDVEGRVGLGVAARLRLGEDVGELAPGVAHLGEDEVAGAVDDARHPQDAVAGEPLAQGLDDRDAAGDGGLEGDHDAAALRRLEDLVAVQGDEGLVGGDDVLAALDRGQHQLARRIGAADELDDDVDRGVLDERARVAVHGDALGRAGPRPRGVAHRRAHHLDGAARAAGDLVGVATQHRHGAAADRAEAEQADPHGAHQRAPPTAAPAAASRRNMARMQRTAWRVRCSFSIRLKRT